MQSITIDNQTVYNHLNNNDIYYNIFILNLDPSILIDTKGDVKDINKSALNILGYSKKEILNNHFSKLNLFKEEEINNIKNSIKSLSDMRRYKKMNVKYHKKDGSYGYAEVHLSLIKFKDVILGYHISMRDISKIENEQYPYLIEKSDKRWRSLIEMAPDGIVTMNVKGTITSVNESFLNLTGFSEDDIIGKHFSKIGTIRTSDLPRYIKIFTSVLRGKVSGPFEMTYKKKDGSSQFGEIHVKLVNIGKNERELLVIARDITQRKKDEEKLLNNMKELVRSNKELDDYTYAVSHDLKAPLRTIEAFSEFLLDDYAERLDDEGKDYLKRIMNASIRMKDLIDDLLLISRVGRKHTETEFVDLNKLIEEIKLDFESPLEERGGKIISDKLPNIKTQKIWIRQLFSNLISNGLKFNKSPDPKIWVSCEERLDDYVFGVRDNGIGIDKKYHEQIFKIFQRLHSQDEYPGTGAGLTICKKIVESFGGKIWVESKSGKGSSFYFTHLKDVSDRVDESEVHPETDQSMFQVQEEIPVNIE